MALRSPPCYDGGEFQPGNLGLFGRKHGVNKSKSAIKTCTPPNFPTGRFWEKADGIRIAEQIREANGAALQFRTYK